MTALDLSYLRDKPVPVMGLGISGLATALALQKSGVEVWAWDDSPESVAKARAAGAHVVDLTTADLSKAEILVLSPGIPHSFPEPHPIVLRARDARLKLVGDVELLARAAPKARKVGITGTNGKSTTTALIGHVLQSAGRTVAIGGNLGTPVLSFPALDETGIYVLEMSSYQLELLDTLVFDVGVHLNVTPDHLDRHGGMPGYVAAKARMFKGQHEGQTAIIGVDDLHSVDIAKGIDRQRLVRLSVKHAEPGGVAVIDGVIVENGRTVADIRDFPTLPGAHNWQNAGAAYAACRALGLDDATVVAGMRSFPGLPHRQQLVATLGGVRFVNDSKATNADAAAKALGCYERIRWIAGGRPKIGGLTGLDRYMPRVAKAYLIGEAQADFARWLDGRAPFALCGHLERALADAAREAQPGDVVLLAPACASFDQYRSFEVRGQHFMELVRALASKGGS
jgi:UDP-N-acetylmuramoylalanine--D-glutamate ligase